MSQASATINSGNQFTPWVQLFRSSENGMVLRWSGLDSDTILSTQWKRPNEADALATTDRRFLEANDGATGIRWGRISGGWLVRAGVLSGEFDKGPLTVTIYNDDDDGRVAV